MREPTSDEMKGTDTHTALASEMQSPSTDTSAAAACDDRAGTDTHTGLEEKVTEVQPKIQKVDPTPLCRDPQPETQNQPKPVS